MDRTQVVPGASLVSFIRESNMLIQPTDITIAITLYRRLEYIEGALASAVNQSVPVNVVVYDDGCDDPAWLRATIAKYGPQVEYRRNPQTLGLFGNMNACITDCPTTWLSILHDDDRLAPDFVERVQQAASQMDGCALYFGNTVYMKPEGEPFHRSDDEVAASWIQIAPEEFAVRNHFAFPGQLMHAPTARALGGFPRHSLYTGDWDLWFRLTLEGGAVRLKDETGVHRVHWSADRGTVAAVKSGRKLPCCAMQAKRNFARLRLQGSSARFNRETWVDKQVFSYRELLVYSPTMPSWLLTYNRCFALTKKPGGLVSHAIYWFTKVFGNAALRLGGLALQFLGKIGWKIMPRF